MYKKIILLFFCGISPALNALVVGSDSLLSIEPLAVFTSADNDNSLQTFGWLKNGFLLTDVNTTSTFKSIFPVTGPITLNGGQLWLANNLVLENSASIASNGIIMGNNYSLDLAESVTWWSRSYPMTVDTLNIFLNNDLAITGTVTFQDNCIFDGGNHRVTLTPGSQLLFTPGSLTTFKNVELYGLNNSTLQLADDSAALILDNVRLVESSDVHFTKGSMLFSNNVNFAGQKTFFYESALTSTIKTDSTWNLSNIATLRIGRKNNIRDREPLFFEDNTSTLRMENNTLSVTSSGMTLTRGQLFSDGQINFSMDSTNFDGGLQLGDGTNDGNFYFLFYPEAVLNIAKGHFIYNIIGSKSGFINDESNIRFIKKIPGTHFLTKQDLAFTNVTIKTNPASTINVAPGKKIYFNNVSVEIPVEVGSTDFVITATRTSDLSFLLGGNGLVELHFGHYPLLTTVSGKNNKISGIGTINGPLNLLDNNTELVIDFAGKFATNIVSTGSKIILLNDLIFARGSKIVGTSTVVTGSNNVIVDLSGGDWTSSVTWQAAISAFNIASDLRLTSSMTFKGNWIINGNGNTINFATFGNIVVDANSSVYFHNINIVGFSNQQIRCIDNSSPDVS